METLESLLLGILQGLTEFLPVSSSGHLVIAQYFLGSSLGGGIVFEVALHVATMVAILLFYRRRVGALAIGAMTGKTDSWEYIGKLIVGTLPAVAVALLARDWIERSFDSPWVAGVCLLVTGLIVWSTRYTLPCAKKSQVTWTMALLIGCAQAIAILPGISRSGSTVAIALALGVAPLVAAEFSFLLGVIAIAGAGVLLVPELSNMSDAVLNAIAVGGIAALVSGLIALWLFVWLLREQRFHMFAWYTWLLGTVTLISVVFALV